MLRLLPGLLTLALTIYAAIDCIQADQDRVRNLPKIAWVALILVIPVFGPVAWFFAGRPRSPTVGSGRRRQPPPRGPDDDPDFLRGL